jgi:nitrate reductase gamma subunit
MKLPNRNASISGLLLALLVATSMFAGSNGLAHFDAALTGYALTSLLAAFAVGYRFTVWAQRPPSRMYFKRGFELSFKRAAPASASAAQTPTGGLPLPYGAGTLASALARNFVAQDFIRRRSSYRWIMHLCLSGGCTLAFAITFPLVFGWVHFEAADSAEVYNIVVFGLSIDSMHTASVKAFLAFNALNIAAVFVLVGLVMAGFRRITDAGERATQTFLEDILPLLLIAAVTVTGLALTISYKFLGGGGHATWAIVHMLCVAALLLYIPFGKLFHMFQRTCALCVSRYKVVGASGARAHCRCCGEDYGSQMHVNDLKVVLEQLGFDYSFGAPDAAHYQDICPPCRRQRLAFTQGRQLGR